VWGPAGGSPDDRAGTELVGKHGPGTSAQPNRNVEPKGCPYQERDGGQETL